MQIIRTIESSMTHGAAWDVRILLLSHEGEQGMTARRLANLGGKVDVVDELFRALSEVIDDPAGYRLLVIDCDSGGVGGLAAAQRAVQMLDQPLKRIPVILISHECREQQFPDDRTRPLVLRAPLSAVAIKVALDHAFPERSIPEGA